MAIRQHARVGCISILLGLYAGLVWGNDKFMEQRYARLRHSVEALKLFETRQVPSAVRPQPVWVMSVSRALNSIWRIRSSEALVRKIHYEAMRAGLDPVLVLSVIEVESSFNRLAISHAGAQGYMQIMPFWQKLLGYEQDDLFETRSNLRYGCVILRHYLNLEQGNLVKALARYNGSVGSRVYAQKVEKAYRAWLKRLASF